MVTAIISLYYPEETVIGNVCSIAGQADRVILCDNSNTYNSKFFKSISNVEYVGFGKNLGLSNAFNTVLKDERFGWTEEEFVVFFDQDSSISEGHIKKLKNEFIELKQEGYELGCIGPVFYNTSNRRIESPKMKAYLTEHTYRVKNLITSSMLTQYKILKKLGFWNENIFLDFVDWDFCWRLQTKEFICCMTEKTILNHSVGNGEKKVGPIRLRVGASFRVYYQTRDALYLLRERYVPFKMRIKLLLTVFVRPIVHYFCLSDGKKRMGYVWRGIKDFQSGVRGEVVL